MVAGRLDERRQTNWATPRLTLGRAKPGRRLPGPAPGARNVLVAGLALCFVGWWKRCEIFDYRLSMTCAYPMAGLQELLAAHMVSFDAMLKNAFMCYKFVLILLNVFLWNAATKEAHKAQIYCTQRRAGGRASLMFLVRPPLPPPPPPPAVKSEELKSKANEFHFCFFLHFPFSLSELFSQAFLHLCGH